MRGWIDIMKLAFLFRNKKIKSIHFPEKSYILSSIPDTSAPYVPRQHQLNIEDQEKKVPQEYDHWKKKIKERTFLPQKYNHCNDSVILHTLC